MNIDIFNNREALINKQVFYRAVVEDREDPEKLNRVRVRIMGIHSIDKTKVETDHLPWAEISQPALFGGQNAGIGISSVPLKGTWVWVFLDDGDFNRPIITGSMYGIPTKIDGTGFYDPDGIHPKKLNEQDTNRLANQNKFGETLITTIKIANNDAGIPTTTGSTWSEPSEHTSKAKYPDNTVIETIEGNIIEYDDTPGNARIHYFHKSGTYWEMLENGDYIHKTTNNNYNIIDNNSYRLIKNSEYTTIQQNQEIKVDGKHDNYVGGTQKLEVQGTKDEIVQGAVSETYSSGQTTDGGPSIKMTAGIINLN